MLDIKHKLATLIFCILCINIVHADAGTQPFSLDGFIVLEDVSNFSGGIRTGSIFNGIYHGIVNYDFSCPNHASMRVGILAITYTQNQALYTGASQNVSNLSAQREVRIAELNYYQQLSSWADVRIGIMDLREYLNVYDVPKELINSGFGTDRVMSNSTNVATYPYPGIGVVFAFEKNAFGLSVATFQGNPQHQNTFFHDGIFFLEEFSWHNNLKVQYHPDLYLKVGTWQYYQPNPTIGFSNIGIYLMGQAVWINAYQHEINLFAQIGYGPNNANNLPYSFTFGSNITNLIPCRPKDIVSFGFSQVWLRNATPEKVFETNYNFYILEYLFLKPDLQYIVKPNGTLPNAWAGILRLVYNINGHLLQKH